MGDVRAARHRRRAADARRSRAPRPGLRFGAAVAAQWLASMYLGVMLLSFLAPFIAVVALAWRVRPTRQARSSRCAAAGGDRAAVVRRPRPSVFEEPRDARRARPAGSVGRQRRGERLRDSAHPPRRPTSGTGSRGHRTERELFPGTSTIVLAAAGLMPPLTAATIATIVAGAITFDWSLGFKGLTYDDLYKRSTVYRGMRVPARFSVLVGAALALLAAFGARRAPAAGPHASGARGLCSALTLVVLFDLRLDPQLGLLADDPVDLLAGHARHGARGVAASSDRSTSCTSRRTTGRGCWAATAASSVGDAAEDGWKAFPSPAATGAAPRGATHLTYNCALEERQNRCAAVFESLDGDPGLELVASERWERADVRLYRSSSAYWRLVGHRRFVGLAVAVPVGVSVTGSLTATTALGCLARARRWR